MAEGDPHALGTLYDRHSVAVYTHVIHLLGAAADAEDVVEDTFWNAWRKAGGYEPGISSVEAWLLGMARRRAVERRAAKKRSGATMVSKGGDPPQPNLPAIDKLPDPERRALSLAFFKAMPIDQIAADLHVPESAVAEAIRSGMDMIGTHLRPVVTDVPTIVEDGE